MKIYEGRLVSVVPDEEAFCQIAFEAGLRDGSHSLLTSPIDDLNESDTTKILAGLARISLGDLGPDYHGLTPKIAKEMIDSLYRDTFPGSA